MFSTRLRRNPARILILSLTVFCTASLLDAQESDPWIMKDVPEAGSRELARAETSPVAWSVSAGKGELAIARWAPGPAVELRYAGGTLVGSVLEKDTPGRLVFFPSGSTGPGASSGSAKNAETKAPVVLFQADVYGIYQFGSGTYALSGDISAERTGGRLWEIRDGSPTPRAVWIVDFSEPAYAMCLDDSSRLLIVTRTKLYRIDLRVKRIETLMSGAFWASLRPNSAVFVDGILHIGMRGGVASVDIGNTRMAWTPRDIP